MQSPRKSMDNAPEVVPSPQPGLEPVYNHDKYTAAPKYAGAHEQPIYPHQQQQYAAPPPRRKGPLGLAPWALAAVAALLTAVILSIGLGAGLGTAYSSCRGDLEQANGRIGALTHSLQQSNTSTSSPTNSSSTNPTPNNNLANYTVAPAKSVESLASDCPSLNGKTYSTHANQTFRVDCGYDLSLGNYRTTLGTPMTDLTSLIAYSIQDCIEACSSLNLQSYLQRRGDFVCKGVTWFKNLQATVGFIGSNCWLKNATLADGAKGGTNVLSISAQQI